MKSFLFGFSSIFLAVTAFAEAPFEVPASCLDALYDNGICVQAEPSTDEKGSVDAEAFMLLYKTDFPDLQAAAYQYFDFEKWGAYYQAAEYDKTTVIASQPMDPLETVDDDGNPVTYLRDYFIMDTKIPVIGKQRVRGVSYYQDRSPDLSRHLSWSFWLARGEAIEVPEGEPVLTDSEGLAKQTGIMDIVECDEFDLCAEDEILIRYKARMRHEIAILPKYASAFSRDQFEALFTGMFLR